MLKIKLCCLLDSRPLWSPCRRPVCSRWWETACQAPRLYPQPLCGFQRLWRDTPRVRFLCVLPGGSWLCPGFMVCRFHRFLNLFGSILSHLLLEYCGRPLLPALWLPHAGASHSPSSSATVSACFSLTQFGCFYFSDQLRLPCY